MLLWDGDSRTPITSTTTGLDWIGGACFSHDGSSLAVAGDKSLLLFDLNGELHRRYSVGALANDVAFSPTGSFLAVATADADLKLVDLASAAITSIPGHQSSINAVSWTRSDMLITSSFDGFVIVRDGATSEIRHRLECHGEPVWSTSAAGDNEHIVSVTSGGLATLWRLPQEAPACVLRVDGALSATSVEPQGRRVALAGSAGLYLAEIRPPSA
jgi:WD40 repeat protein